MVEAEAQMVVEGEGLAFRGVEEAHPPDTVTEALPKGVVLPLLVPRKNETEGRGPVGEGDTETEGLLELDGVAPGDKLPLVLGVPEGLREGLQDSELDPLLLPLAAPLSVTL